MSAKIVPTWKLFYHAVPFKKQALLSLKTPSQSSRLPQVFTRTLSTKQNISAGKTEWKGIITGFLPIGICLVAVMQWRAFRRKHGDQVATQWEISCYCMLPLRTLSRFWGYVAEVNLPASLRPPVYRLYSNAFGVNISEAANEDLKSYGSLADFFARSLKNGARVVDKESCLVAPCDGTILHLGTVVDSEHVEQVKGVTYSLKDFLGESWKENKSMGDLRTSLLHRPHEGNKLYQCVIYLAPGDYHRFHSPAEWKPTLRRHISGELLSVNPSIARWLPGLFTLNERAVYLGQWEHGFFSYTAVGATNVGTVKVYFDRTLHTNRRAAANATERCRERNLGGSVELSKGQICGEFRMGSTVVLIFEAPADFRFAFSPGERVKMGQRLGCVGRQGFVDRLVNERVGLKGAS